MTSWRLLRDDRGAIALMGLMMALFLTAMLFYLIGIGETVLQRERMQDAADAAAFSAAVLHARGMNTLVLINMVMAALLAVLVALKLVELLTTIAIVAITLVSYFAPALAGVIPELAELRSDVKEAHDAVRPEIESALEALHAAASGVRILIPAASELRVLDLIPAGYGPHAQVAFAVPASLTLPTRDDDYARLCEKAGDYVGRIAALPFKPLPLGPVADTVRSATRSLAAARADWFCGASGSAPSATVERKQYYPVLESRAQCAAVDTMHDYDPDAHAALCLRAGQDETDSQPDGLGHCKTRCSDDGPYAERDAKARVACAPSKGVKLYGFSWQERRFTREYGMARGQWTRVSDPEHEERSATYTRRGGDQRPCGSERARVGRAWKVATHDEAGRPQPLCVDPHFPIALRVGETQERTVTEVTHLFGCKERVRQRYELPAEDREDHVAGSGSSDSDNSKSPQTLEDDAELGAETFQVRAAVIGSLPDEGVARLVALAAQGAAFSPAQRTAWRAERALGRVAIAQSEYYFALTDPAQPRDEWMWNMRWQARLRRVHAADRRDGPESSQASSQEPDTKPSADFSPGLIADSLPQACELFAPSSDGEGDSPCQALEQAFAADVLH